MSFIKNSLQFKRNITTAIFLLSLLFGQISYAQFSANLTSTNAVCSGSDVFLNISGGTAPYTVTYYLNGFPTTVTTSGPGYTNPFKITVTNPNAYQISFTIGTVTDVSSNYATLGAVNLSVYPSPYANIGVTSLSGCTYSNLLKINSYQGSPSFKVQLTESGNPWNLPTIGPANSPGIYLPSGVTFNFQTITDLNNCTAPLGYSLTIPPSPLTLVATTPTTSTCGTKLSLVNPPSGYIYMWFLDGYNTGGSGNEIYATASGNYYSVGVSPDGRCYISSNYINVTVNGGITPSTPQILIPSGPYICGQSIRIGPANPFYDIYTWMKNGIVVQEGSSPYLNITSSGGYSLTAKFNGGCPSGVSNTFNAVFQNSGFTSPVITATSNSINCWETSTLSVSNGTYDSYQWLKNGTEIPGATNSTYNVTQTTSGTYSVKVTQGGCNSGISNQLNIAVAPLAQPALNQIGQFSITLNSGQNVLNDLSNNVYDSYQWQSSTNGSTYTDIPGATQVNYTFTNSNTYYILKVTKGGCQAVSNYAYPSLTNGPKITPVGVGSFPMIMCSSGAKLNTDPGYSAYQWYKDNVLISGETGNQIDLGKPGNGTGSYSVKITDSFGLTYIAPNATVQIFADIKPVVSVQSPTCTGDVGILSVSQTSNNSKYRHYTWINSSGTKIFDYDLASVTNNNTTASVFVNAGDYTLTVTDFAGCTSTQTVTVSPGSGTPVFTPVIAPQGGSANLCRTGTTGITLQVTNIGSLPTPTQGNVYLYRWLLNGSPAPLSGGGLPSLFGSSSYNALVSGTYSLEISEVNSDYPNLPQSGWSAGQCFGISNAITANVDFIPTTGFTISSSTACISKDVTITYTGNASATTSFNWNFGQAGDYTIVSGTGRGPYVLRYATPGSKSISLTLNNGVCPIQTSPVQTINVVSPTPIVISSSQLSIYPGCKSALQSNIRAIDSWSGGPFTLPDPVQPFFALASPTQTTTYTATGTDINQCATSGSITITVLSSTPNTNFSYGSSSSLCQTSTAVNPVFTGTAVNGHFFSSDKSGISLDQYNGTINPSISNPGNYNVTNTVTPLFTNGISCPVFKTTIPITIIAKTVLATCAYSKNNYCSSEGIISPVVAQTVNGVYSFYPANNGGGPANGLDLDPVNGQINLANCSTGTYFVRFTASVDASCAPTYTETVVSVTKAKDPSFSYPQTSYCNNVVGSQAIPNYVANPGQFSLNPWSINLNQQNGTVDIYNAAGGSYTVTNTIYAFGNCPTVSANATITVYVPKVAAYFSYKNSANTDVIEFCEGTTGTLTPFFTPLSGQGTLTITPVPTRGWTLAGIDMSIIPAGSYTISNTVYDAQCNVTTSTTYPLNVKPKPSVTVSDKAICSGSSFNQPLSSIPSGSLFSWITAVTSGNVIGYSDGTGIAINPTLTLSTGSTSAATIKYTITPSLNLCPGNPVDMLVTVNPIPTLVPFANKTICSGTTLNVPLSSNIAGADISWNASQISGNVTGFSSGVGTSINQTLIGSGVVNYAIHTSLNGCSTVYNFQVTVNPVPALTTIPPSTLSICNGGTISQLLSASPAGASINWTTTVTSGALTGVYSGNGTTINQNAWLSSGATTPSVVKYTLAPTLNGCTGTSADMIVNVNPIPSLTYINNKTLCGGNTLSVPLSSNVPGTTFSWSVSQNSGGTVIGFSSGSGSFINQTLTGSGVLNYTVTGSLNGCSSSSSFTVTVNPTPALTVTLPSLNICSGSNFSQTLTATPAGSSIAWTSTVTGPVTGNGNGSGNVINQNLWLPTGTTAPGTATYTFIPSLNGCFGLPANMSVTVNPIPTLTTVTNKTVCSGVPLSIPLTTNIAGAVTSWTASLNSGTVSGFSAGSGPSISHTLIGSGVVNYSVTTSLNSCSSSVSSFTVTVNPSPVISVNVSSQDVCSGTQITYSYTKPSGFTNPVPTNIPGSSFSIANSSITSTGGTYLLNTLSAPGSDIVLTVTNPATTCSTTDVKHINIRPVPVVTANSLTICEGNDLSLPVTSSVAGSTFSWTSTTTGTLNLVASGTTVPITATAVIGNGTKTYTITATAAQCISSPKTVALTVNPSVPISLSVSPTTLCEGTTLNVVRSFPASGTGYVVTYSRPVDFNVGTNSLSTTNGISTATESVTASGVSGSFILTSVSSLGCIRSLSVPINVKPAPTIVASNVIICEGATFDIPLASNTPGVTYSWLRTSVTGNVTGYPMIGTSDHISGTPSGSGTITYKVNCTGPNGCVSQDQMLNVTINQNLPSSLTVSPTTVCEGVTLGVGVNYPIGYTAVYTRAPGFSPLGGGGHSGGGYQGFNEGVKAGTMSGNFTLVVTSPAGCVNNYSVPVTVLPAPVISASNISICEGMGFDVPLSSSTPGVSYSWTLNSITGNVSGYPTSGTSDHISASAITGNGSISYTANSISTNGCISANLNITVTVNPNLPSTLTVTPTTVCEGGTVNANVNYPIGYTALYTRAPGFTVLGGAGHSGGGYQGFGEGLKAGATSGDFNLTVTSPAGCVNSIPVHITILPRPDVFASNVSICEGSGFDIPLSSTSGISFTWSSTSVSGTVTGYPTSGTASHINASAITGNGTIIYKVNSISSSNCISSDLLVTVTVNPNAPHDAGFYVSQSNTQLPNPSTICQGSQFSFAARIPLNSTYTYTPPSSSDFQQINGGGDNNGFGRQYIATSGNDGVFTYTTVSDLGCTRTSVYTMYVNPAPSAPVINYSSSSSNVICSGSNGFIGYNIEAGIDYSMSYDVGLIANTGICGQNTTTYGCSVTWGNSDGFLTVVGTNQYGCSTTSSVFVPVQSTPVINQVTPDPICSGGTTAIALNSVPNNSTIKYEWESFVISGTINAKNSSEMVSSGEVYTAPGYGYTIQETLAGSGSMYYNVTATTQNLSGCSSQTTIFQDVVQASTPSVTVSYSPTFFGSVPQVNQIVFTAYPVNCGSNPHYQWKVNGINVAGATGPTYQNPNLIISARGSIPDKVSCTVTSSDPCSNGVQVTSPQVVISCSVCRMTADLSTDPSSDQNVAVYPNPFAESVHVNIPDAFGENVEVVIKDLNGIEVEHLITNTGEADLGKSLGSGVYILQVSTKSGIETFKIVKAQ